MINEGIVFGNYKKYNGIYDNKLYKKNNFKKLKKLNIKNVKPKIKIIKNKYGTIKMPSNEVKELMNPLYGTEYKDRSTYYPYSSFYAKSYIDGIWERIEKQRSKIDFINYYSQTTKEFQKATKIKTYNLNKLKKYQLYKKVGSNKKINTNKEINDFLKSINISTQKIATPLAPLGSITKHGPRKKYKRKEDMMANINKNRRIFNYYSVIAGSRRRKRLSKRARSRRTFNYYSVIAGSRRRYRKR